MSRNVATKTTSELMSFFTVFLFLSMSAPGQTDVVPCAGSIGNDSELARFVRRLSFPKREHYVYISNGARREHINVLKRGMQHTVNTLHAAFERRLDI